jgi:hypothetical protein
MERGGSRPKPPKAVTRRASLEAPHSMSDHKKAKQRLTAKTVAVFDDANGRDVRVADVFGATLTSAGRREAGVPSD